MLTFLGNVPKKMVLTDITAAFAQLLQAQCTSCHIMFLFREPGQHFPPGVQISVKGYKFFSSPNCPDRFWGPLSLLFSRHRGSCQWAKQPGRETNH